MKAIVFTRYGSPDGLELREVPRPTPEDDELLISVHASSINSWDWEFLNGTPFLNRLMFGLLKPKPGKQILGADIAGTVEAVGRRVTRFQPGDEVFGDLWDNWGGFAEYACALRMAGRMQPGQKVLINGAGGGVGTFAIQLAKRSGTEVTGVDAPHKLNVVRSVGADHVIDYTQRDFTSTAERYDLIIDCQSSRSMADYKRALRPGGTYAMVGGSRVLPLLFESFRASLTGESRKFRLVAEGPNKGLAELKELLEAGELVPIIDRTYRLSEVPEALRYFGEGRHKGKIAIAV
jgi:NADPH:quinone reductase-like Zn-dependent oxidoreductase